MTKPLEPLSAWPTVLPVVVEPGRDCPLQDRLVQDRLVQDRSLQDCPLLARSDHGAPSVFRPENMLREARRQKGLGPGPVPRVCVLDPDGDMVGFVRSAKGAMRSPGWACYHTRLWEWQEGGERFGIVGHAVGGPFAVLVAEQLFASGCELVISVASAGRIAPDEAARHGSTYVLIERALRDEGTSHHYLPPAAFVEAEPGLVGIAEGALLHEATAPQAAWHLRRGTSWTTDAPFRETAGAIADRRALGILTVEMEAASLLAFAAAARRPVLCLAHVTNQLGCVEGDFEKGEGNGAALSIALAQAITAAWARRVTVGGIRD